jgi:hypothetical protein
MSHDPALDAHEHREHAEHAAHAGDPFISQVSITIAVLAVLAAAAGSLETIENSLAITASSKSVLAQDEATDGWNEYQADSLKRHLYSIAAKEGGPRAAEFQRTADEQSSKQPASRARAIKEEAERNRLLAESDEHERRHHWLTAAATLLEIGIALSTVTIITKRKPLWFGALGLGVVGLSLLAIAYVL